MSNDLTGLRTFLGAGQGEFAKAIRGNITPELLVRTCLTYVQKQPKVLECSKESIAKCLLDCAALGLLPDGTLGTAYLVPYKTTCTLIIGYRGMIELARRSGELTKVEARVVREGDVFDVRFGTSPELKHVPDFKGSADRPIVAVYAIAKFHNGQEQAEVMGVGEIEAIRRRSRAADSGPWVSDFAEMAKKTVVRRLCKYLPLTPELATAFEADDREVIADVDVTVKDEKPPTKAKALAKQLAHKPVTPVQDAIDALPTSEPEPVASQPEPAPAKEATVEPKAIEPDVLTAKDKVKIGTMGSGKPMLRPVVECSDDDLTEAITFAQADVDDPQATPESKAHAMGVVKICTETLNRRKLEAPAPRGAKAKVD